MERMIPLGKISQATSDFRLRRLIARCLDFPLRSIAMTLWERLRKAQLVLTAGSLTFTTLLALVPLFALVLSAFTTFPAFAHLEAELRQWLVENLIPDSIAGQVMRHLTQFAGKARELGILGLAGLMAVAVFLMLTIDRTLNRIWHASRKRPLGQRILMNLAAITLGPLVLGISLATTSYLVTASRGWMPDLPGSIDFALASIHFFLMTTGITLLYHFVPNIPVRWLHALAGAVFAALFLSLARHGLGWYLAIMPDYSIIYGTFATLPIFLLWIYVAWLIVLLGAVIAAYLPGLLSGAVHRENKPGWKFQLATDVLRTLAQARRNTTRGLTRLQLTQALQTDILQLTPVLDTLIGLDWIGELATHKRNEEPRLVLLVEPGRILLAPLIERLLLAPDPSLATVWNDKPLRDLTLADITDTAENPDPAGNTP
ncbi:YihY family inner membrane protein [uncultured Nitrosomonas sp.]|uniref:YihY family inner membrane protein n=1 Tax=uncultured Nitrosomonas sp. TaxID=156424 RepID=UPI002622FB2A|nr:YihY family inner membrane protein [uncultured Nitrosomonas sp.]